MGALTIEASPSPSRSKVEFRHPKGVAVNPDAEWVLVHDAARPCLSRENLVELLDRGLAHEDGAILALPVRDTLKMSADATQPLKPGTRSP